MNISSQIIEVLDHLCYKFGIAIDWSQENITPYLKELAGKYISWEVATSTLWIWLGVAILVLAIVLWIAEAITGFMDGFAFFLAFMMAVGAIALIMTQALDIMTCNHFPEKQIVEYINYLLSTT